MIQSAFEQAIRETSYEMIADAVTRKLATKGIDLAPQDRRKLIEHLRSGNGGSFHTGRQWWSKGDAATIELADEDIHALEDRFVEFLTNRLPDLIPSLIDETATTILPTLRRSWPRELRRESRVRRAFNAHLTDRWGKPIDLLRTLLAVSREYGEMASDELRNDSEFDSPCLLGVLTRLHARACQVTDEIITLLASGFADGAMARWRTLHEIAIVAMFLREHGEPSAIRYVDHDAVESYHAAIDYRNCSERLGYEALSQSEFEEAERKFERVVSQYGSPFKSQYGWAAAALAPKGPTLLNIEEAAGIAHLRAHYRLASHNVHANPKGVFYKLGLIGEVDLLLAGPSNAGLADPGQSAAVSLMQVSSALGLLQPSMDTLFGLSVLMKLVDEIGDEFTEASQLLESDTRRDHEQAVE